jgi:cytochrome b
LKRILVWDFPVRIFHWVFGAGMAAALVIALLSRHSSAIFPYHSLIGLVIGLLVALRLVWGFAGTRYARFASFVYSPARVFSYLKAALTWKETRYLGHNPGSSYAIFAMLAIAAAQVTTGLMLGSGNRGVKQVHELLAYAMLGVIVVHLLGVAIHTLRHRENIARSMVDGRKDGEAGGAIPSARPLVGAAFLLVVGFFGASIVRNYNAIRQTTRLPLLGTQIQIGEGEEEVE